MGREAPCPLPCLFVTTQTDDTPKFNKSSVAKKAETLYANIDGLIKRVGIESIVFVTLTTPDNCTDRFEAQRRFNNLARRVLPELFLEYIAVPERQERGAFHWHLVAVAKGDVRTGFDFDACKLSKVAGRNGNRGERRRQQRIYFKSANVTLKHCWHYLREMAPKYQFGRCETLPVFSNAQALARYVGSYVTSAWSNRTISDKGLRTVRYSLAQRTASCKWSWADGNGKKWRRGLALLGCILEMDYDELKEKFSTKVFWNKREAITVLGENYDEALEFVAKIPAYADYRSRCDFLGALVRHFSRDGESDVCSALELQQPF